MVEPEDNSSSDTLKRPRLPLILGYIVHDGLPLLSLNRNDTLSNEYIVDQNLQYILVIRLVHLLEQVCWNVADILVSKYVSFLFLSFFSSLTFHRLKDIFQPRMIDVLLNTSQPTELTIATLRFLLIFTSRKYCKINSFELLLSVIVGKNMSPFLIYPLASLNASQTPVIDTLCQFLTEGLDKPVC